MAADPAVLFCVGATKAGTGWLFRFLQSHPQCHVRSIKELHYFDALDLDDRDWHRDFIQDQRRQTAERLSGANFARRGKLARQLADYDDLIALHRSEPEDIAGYLRYLKKGRTLERVVADVTPAYSLLSTQRLHKMARIADQVRFIYILRDPVARLWSHIRMNAARRARFPQEVQGRANRIFWRYGRGRHPAIRARGEYRAALERLTSALNPSQLLVLFYEELFTHAAVDLICDFLGIAYRRADLRVRVNTGPPATMNDIQRQHARDWLADQYDYVQATLDSVPDAWRVNMVRA